MIHVPVMLLENKESHSTVTGFALDAKLHNISSRNKVSKVITGNNINYTLLRYIQKKKRERTMTLKKLSCMMLLLLQY